MEMAGTRLLKTKSETDDETVSETTKWTKSQRSTPEWGNEAKNGDHLWSRTSVSGDLCYVTDNLCAKYGRRLKCASCKIIVHSECVSPLTEKMKILCRSTFQDAGIRLYRERTEISHHWIARGSQKGRCRHCSKSFQTKLPFGGKVCNLLSETVAMSCSWCKTAYHNKDSCFNQKLRNEENCTLGTHGNVIVPPTWIVKLPMKGMFRSSLRKHSDESNEDTADLSEETDSQKQTFAIKPIPSATSKPLLIFINPKSGGNQGSKLLRIFQWLLNPRQVFDLTEGGPNKGLDLYRRVPNLRILACGGDGTVGWILSVLDDLKVLPHPPIAVLPLGTGNDLARALGWGGGYTDEPISKILTNVEDGEIVKLDRWLLKVSSNKNVDLANCEDGRSTLSLNVVNNYFSLGVDALIALEFHEAREARPDKFNSRFRNKMFYGQAGGKDLIQRKWKDLCNFVTLECDGQDLTHKLKELKVHSILFLNIPSYGGGTRPWGSPGTPFQPQRTDDGMIEVIGLTTYQLPLLQAGAHGTCITQCRGAKLTTACTIPVQVDGEPCRLLPSVIDIELWNTVNMVVKTKKHGNVRKEQSLEKMTLEVKRLRMPDYIQHHHRETLKDKASPLGSLSVNLDTDLADIRVQVNQLIEGKEQTSNNKEDKPEEKEREDDNEDNNEDHTLDWCFLDSCTAERFFRIDLAQEQLHYVVDICDQELFILDQSTELDTPCHVVSEEAAVDADDVSRESTSSATSEQSQDSDDRDLAEAEAEEDELIAAAKLGNLQEVARLHGQGHDLLVVDDEGRTALHHAAFYGNRDVVRYLVACGPPSLLDMTDRIMYHTALHRAAARRDPVICSILVCAGASLAIPDKQGLTVQQLAELVGDKPLSDYLEAMKDVVML